MSKKYFIIGISGATNSGKTTLVHQLCQKFQGASSMCQDYYFLEPDDPRIEALLVPEVNHANWEKLDAMDMDLMMRDVQEWIRKQEDQSRGDNSIGILFIEGILIFNHRPLARMFDKKYFLTLNKDICRVRREGRNYIPADPPGYFDKVVWPMYIQNKDELKDQKDIIYFSGADEQEATIGSVCEDILTLSPDIPNQFV